MMLANARNRSDSVCPLLLPDSGSFRMPVAVLASANRAKNVPAQRRKGGCWFMGSLDSQKVTEITEITDVGSCMMTEVTSK